MERRALIAVAISLFILIVYQELVLKRLYPPQPQAAAPQVEAPPESGAPLHDVAPPAAEKPAPPPQALPADARDVTVDTDLYRAVFTTAGARLKSFRLKHYRSTVEADSPPLELIRPGSLEDLPLGLEFRGEGSVNDRATLYAVDRESLEVGTADTGTITFTGRVGGAAVTKQIEVRGDRYPFRLRVSAAEVPANFTQIALSWSEGDGGTHRPGSEVLFDSLIALQGPKLRRAPFAELDAGQVHKEHIAWVAFSGHYFLTAMVPDVAPENDLWAWMKRRPAPAGSLPGEHIVEAQLLLPSGKFSTDLDVYLGPKDIDLLKESGHSLDRAVDLGWFTFVALPLLHVLRLSNRLTGNYGIDIILLTVVLKVIFFPLTQKSFKSMQEMQKLQPQMASIRERFKDKPDEMNREVMELYRRHKVNPLSGCLPMILQLPVFVGLYQALLNAVELRHAPFVGWIHDLSAPDRLGTLLIPFVEPAGFPVLTLLMGASMFVQQWMTPAQGDPTQQRVMMIMPLMFTFMFINFPAGLTLYWLVNNILTISQQYFLLRAAKR